MNKKGYIFTTLAIFVLGILLIIGLAPSPQSNVSPQTRHIQTVNVFLEQLEQDLPRVLSITGYRSLIGIEEHIASTGEYLDDVQAAFVEAMYNGTINGTTYDIFEDATLAQFELRMNDISQRAGVEMYFRIENVTATHIDPWTINVSALLRVYARTRQNRTEFNYTTTTSATFGIQNLRDPLWTVGTSGRVPAVVVRTNQSRPYISAANDTTALQVILNRSQYIETQNAPSMLMRFEGNLSPSPHGIAALVDKKVLSSQELAVFTDRSVADYRYFGLSSTNILQIVNMPTDFFLSSADLDDWDADGKTT